MKLPTFPNLEGLIGLARRDGVDVRPTLMRVLTDIYVQKQGHTRDEERRFTELALWLLSSVDHATRAAVANKLSVYPETPRAVARLLAVDEFDIAEPMLLHSPCLTNEDLLAITIERGSRHAEAIVMRGHRDDRAVLALEAPYDNDRTEVCPTADEFASSDMDIAVDTARDVMATAEKPETSDEFAQRAEAPVGRRFLDAGSEERATILAQLAEASPIERAMPSSPPPFGAIARLEAAALDTKPDDFAHDLQKLLRVSRSVAQEIVDDPRGEPVVVAARAIGMPADVLLRVLLFLNPKIGQSVERVFDLMEVHYQLTPHVAQKLVAGWREPNAVEKRIARYQPLHWDDEAGTRRASDAARRGGFAAQEARSQPGRVTEFGRGDRVQRTT